MRIRWLACVFTGRLCDKHYSKTCVKRPLTKRPKTGFQDKLSLNADQKYCRMLQWEHSAQLSTFIKLLFVVKIFVLSILVAVLKRYIRFGYSLNIMRQSACLVLNPITVYSYGFLLNCTTVGQASDSMTALT